MNRTFLAPLVVVLCAFSADAGAQTAPTPSTPPAALPGLSLPALPAAPLLTEFSAADRDKVMLLLSGFHGIGTRQEFEAATPQARRLLEAIARDSSVGALHQNRALAALAYWNDAGVEALFVNLLNTPTTSEMNRHRLIGFLARTFGERALTWVERYLTDADLQFRLTAVEAIASIATPAALNLLQQALVIEKDAFVQQRLRLVTATPVVSPAP